MFSHLLHEARALQPQAIEDRRYLHLHAETGFDLAETRAYIRKRLEEMGYAPQDCGRCGLVCTIGTGSKTILLRADMDALPIVEESGLPFACTGGRMHACGHDLHAAMLLTAAQLLKNHESELAGRVKLMFQPAEETLMGAKDMIAAGVLENPPVDAAMMIHVLSGQSIPVGTVIVSASGVSAPAAGNFTISIQGKGAHGAMPSAGVDPINIAAHIILALQEINARELALNQSAALTICMAQAGSTANVIPDTALLRGNYRCYDNETADLIRRRIAEISAGTATVFRGKAQVQFDSDCPTLVNDAALCTLAEECLRQTLGADRVYNAAMLAGSSASRSSGSEDFASVSQRVPSVMLALAAGEPEKGCPHPLHHPGVRFDEDALPSGSAAYAAMALAWLKSQ